MWINYSDSEVNVFHPLCEKALKGAISSIGLSSTYEVVHHERANSLEMDFIIKNINTKKVLCVIEIKRTKSDVQSTRYQYQAMSYVQQLSNQMEQPFYMITNLEYAYSFRYSTSKIKPFQQVLNPGLIHIGDFHSYSDEKPYIDILKSFFVQWINDFISNNYAYYLTFDSFMNFIESKKNDIQEWKSSLAILLYQYIRGSFFSVSRNNDLRDIEAFRNDVKRICAEGKTINFNGIFGSDPNEYMGSINIDKDLKDELFKLGKENIVGDIVSDIIHGVVSNGHEHEGEVSTDLELSRIVSLLAKIVLGRGLEDFEFVMDPAAGSGSLISSAIDTFNLLPKQIICNDVNPQFIELLSLRLGLKYATTIKTSDSPVTLSKNILDLGKSFFSNVKIILLNPPYQSGIISRALKDQFRRKMISKFNHVSVMDIGQIGFECVFLEYVVQIINDNTIVSCIMPKQLLVSRGKEAVKFREYLLGDFGLKYIFNYPGLDLFSDVTKDTVVIVGEKNSKINNEVIFLSSLVEVSNIDLHDMEIKLKNHIFQEQKYESISSGLEGMKVTRKSLEETSKDGWRLVNKEMSDGLDFVRNQFSCNPKLQKTSSLPMYRGQIGNKGYSDLLFWKSSTRYADFYLRNNGIESSLTPAIKNSDCSSDLIISNADSFMLNWSALNALELSRTITDFESVPKTSGGQPRSAKTITEIQKILLSDSKKVTNPWSILVPRSLRVKGRVFINTTDFYVSTNFLVINVDDKRKAQIIGGWMTSIFYQLNCEVSSKDHEGARKMEAEDIMSTYIIAYEKITDSEYLDLSSLIKNVEFLDLCNPIIRPIDVFWSKILFPNSFTERLEEAQKILRDLANRRNQKK